jgi:hypothetical protein
LCGEALIGQALGVRMLPPQTNRFGMQSRRIPRQSSLSFGGIGGDCAGPSPSRSLSMSSTALCATQFPWRLHTLERRIDGLGLMNVRTGLQQTVMVTIGPTKQLLSSAPQIGDPITARREELVSSRSFACWIRRCTAGRARECGVLPSGERNRTAD